MKTHGAGNKAVSGDCFEVRFAWRKELNGIQMVSRNHNPPGQARCSTKSMPAAFRQYHYNSIGI